MTYWNVPEEIALTRSRNTQRREEVLAPEIKREERGEVLFMRRKYQKAFRSITRQGELLKNSAGMHPGGGGCFRSNLKKRNGSSVSCHFGGGAPKVKSRSEQ